MKIRLERRQLRKPHLLSSEERQALERAEVVRSRVEGTKSLVKAMPTDGFVETTNKIDTRVHQRRFERDTGEGEEFALYSDAGTILETPSEGRREWLSVAAESWGMRAAFSAVAGFMGEALGRASGPFLRAGQEHWSNPTMGIARKIAGPIGETLLHSGFGLESLSRDLGYQPGRGDDFYLLDTGGFREKATFHASGALSYERHEHGSAPTTK